MQGNARALLARFGAFAPARLEGINLFDKSSRAPPRGRVPLARRRKIREVRRRARLTIQFGLWLSLVERLVRDQEAVGSNPTSPM